MVGHPTTIEELPNEILISILSSFPTTALLPLTAVCRRIHDLIFAVIHTRILEVTHLEQHTLLLECFHPSNKGSSPYFLCRPLHTKRLNGARNGSQQAPQTVAELRDLYTSFRPLRPSSEPRTFQSGLADGGGWFTTRSQVSASPSKKPIENLVEERVEEELVYQDVNLESHELFSQLCTIANLVKVGPKRGLFISCVNVGEGILRVWRDWLADQANGKTGGESEVLWADSKKTVGLRLRVVEQESQGAPGPPPRLGEEREVTYRLFYEELVIRTSQLLLMVENSVEQEVKHEGMLCGLDGQFFILISPTMGRMGQWNATETVDPWGAGSGMSARGIHVA